MAIKTTDKDARVAKMVARSIVRFRRKAGLTQNRLASRAGLNLKVITRIENSDINSMSTNTLSAVAYALRKQLVVEFRDKSQKE